MDKESVLKLLKATPPRGMPEGHGLLLIAGVALPAVLLLLRWGGLSLLWGSALGVLAVAISVRRYCRRP